MLNGDFCAITNKTCQLQHKTLSPHIEFTRLQPQNSLKQVQYLVKNEDILSTRKTKKNVSHPIPVDYGIDQLRLRIQDKGNTVT